MKITLCGSIDHHKQIGEIAKKLQALGHELLLPASVEKIFLYNPIPEIGYKDEISGMLPIVINGDLNKIK